MFLGIESGNHANALIVLVAVEHLLAEGEERLRRHIIILQHNTLVDNGERPFLRDIFGRVASIVALLKLAMHLALPVDVANDTSASLDASHIAFASRSVLIQEELGGSCLAHLVEHLLQVVGTIEEKN